MIVVVCTLIGYLTVSSPCRGGEAQPVEGPSKVPVWCNSTDVGSNPGSVEKSGRRKIILSAPSGNRREKCEEWEKQKLRLTFARV